jgi:predicted NBD/HSP70 family sugar kinase
MLTEALELPVIVHNNSAVLAVSEHDPDHDSTLVILIRAGVGAGMVHGGTIFARGELSVLEFGHMSVYADGRPCSCGGRGCIEAYLSENAILEDVRTALAGKRTSILTLADVDAALENGDPKTAEAIAGKGTVLSTGVRNLVHLLGPQSIVLITRHPAIGFALRNVVAAQLENDRYILDHHNVSIRYAEYDATRAARSAAGTVFDAYLGV